MKKIILALVILAGAVSWFIHETSKKIRVEETPAEDAVTRINADGSPYIENNPDSKIEHRLRKLGWSLENGTTINTTDAVQSAPAPKNQTSNAVNPQETKN